MTGNEGGERERERERWVGGVNMPEPNQGPVSQIQYDLRALPKGTSQMQTASCFTTGCHLQFQIHTSPLRLQHAHVWVTSIEFVLISERCQN